MSYVIFKTDGAVLTTITDGTIDTDSTPLGLPGRLYAGYGQVFDTNVVHLLENFANIAPPSNALAGQLWFNTTNSTLYICPTDNETNPSNWISILSTSPGANTQLGNIDANNLNLTNTLTANLVDTDYLTVNIQANIANANVTGTANIANLVTTDVSASNVAATRLSGSLTTVAQPNITSVGTLTSLGVNGTVTAAAFTANTGVFSGNGSGLTNLSAANITGTVSTATTATTAGTVTTAAQPNITSLGTITGLTSTGNITAPNFIGNIIGNIVGNIVVPGSNTQVLYNDNGQAGASAGLTFNQASGVLALSGNVQASRFIGSGASLTAIPGANVSGTVASATFATSAGTATSATTASTATSATSATTAGTVTTAAQPNITSVGTMSFLTVNGNLNAVNVIGTHFGSGAALTNINGGNVSTVPSATTATTASTALSVAGSNVSGTVANATYAVSAGSATTAGFATTAGSATTAGFATTAGSVTSIPSGTRMLFAQTSAPTGWTKQTSNDNAALRVVSGSASTGGSVNFTSAFTSQAVSGTVGDTALTENQMPNHRHLSGVIDDSPNTIFNQGAAGPSYVGPNGPDGNNNDSYYAGYTDYVGGGATHTHSFSGTAINLAVKYVDVIIAQKD